MPGFTFNRQIMPDFGKMPSKEIFGNYETLVNSGIISGIFQLKNSARFGMTMPELAKLHAIDEFDCNKSLHYLANKTVDKCGG